MRVSQTGVLLLLSSAAALGQSLTLEQAVKNASDRYPATRVSAEQLSAAAAAINLARTAYLPRVDFLSQVNRATRNNMFGMTLPQATLPGISGPPLPENDMTSVFGSITGFTVTWEPFDFGSRQANVRYAEAGRRLAETGVTRTRFEVATAAADAFLTVAAADQTAIAAQAGVERARVLTEIVQAQVRAQLRPGADASRARAELALAENQLIRAQSAIEVAKANLTQFVGGDPTQISVQTGPLLNLPDQGAGAVSVTPSHPVLLQQRSLVEQIQANEQILQRLYYPRFYLQGSNYARGTGALADGSTLGGVNGLGPNIYNWGVGLSVTFPLLDLPSIRSRQEIERHRERAESARYDQFQQDLTAAVAGARANLDGARRVALNTPIQLEAARATEQQMTARYEAGLGTLLEVAEAQRLVTQAEIDDALARLGVWRALLQAAVAQGNLDPFLDQAGK
ncbi:MAG: TolC family protein [Bryobacteraceae bacterium]|nr:TolC family protein [Bryobacteraceae bacterium]